jgi:sulfide:quinone oxidoreductase
MFIDFNGIKGLAEAVGKNGVTSNYHPQHCQVRASKLHPPHPAKPQACVLQYTAELIKNFEGGNAIFTQPNVPIKCAGMTMS